MKHAARVWICSPKHGLEVYPNEPVLGGGLMGGVPVMKAALLCMHGWMLIIKGYQAANSISSFLFLFYFKPSCWVSPQHSKTAMTRCSPSTLDFPASRIYKDQKFICYPVCGILLEQHKTDMLRSPFKRLAAQLKGGSSVLRNFGMLLTCRKLPYAG